MVGLDKKEILVEVTGVIWSLSSVVHVFFFQTLLLPKRKRLSRFSNKVRSDKSSFSTDLIFVKNFTQLVIQAKNFAQ